jgi:hypothetical protein
LDVEYIMASATTRWNLVVSKNTDRDLRQLLASEGRGKKGELSRFVEDAVRKQIFDTTLKAAREHNANVDPNEMDDIIAESLAWARTRLR